jgi:hypothetical protein
MGLGLSMYMEILQLIHEPKTLKVVRKRLSRPPETVVELSSVLLVVHQTLRHQRINRAVSDVG